MPSPDKQRHGKRTYANWPDTIDPYGARESANLDQYVALDWVFCSCDALCTCGWDDIGDE